MREELKRDRKNRRLQLKLANELSGSNNPTHLAEVIGLTHEASKSGELAYSEKCRLARAVVTLRNRTEAPWMAPKRDPKGFAYPRGAPAGTEAGDNWDAI